MASLIEDYALIGDTATAALVGRDGSIDWLCLPRFDSAACFAALLGERGHGRWRLSPVGSVRRVTRRYRGDTMVLETCFVTDDGEVAVIDFMRVRDGHMPALMRLVEGRRGSVTVATDLLVRFDYGALVPWVRRVEGGGVALGGADGVVLRTPVELEGRDLATVGEFTVEAGERVPFCMQWFPSHMEPPEAEDVSEALEETERWWQGWADRCTYDGQWRDEVLRSLLVLKALTYAPTGGIVAAATTSLPEWIGSVRNWDYRYCWLRDATFTLTALSIGGYVDEALAWSRWLRRAVAGSPEKIQIMYGLRGERRLTETELEWLPGYEGSRPVRVGNAASGQFQLDVYGEVMDMFLHSQRLLDHRLPDDAWDLARMLVEHVASVWTEPDDGIWEVRGPRRHFVHSKVMAWVAVDRWIRLCESAGRDGQLGRWRDLRADMHREICERGFNPAVGAFTQYYGSDQLDASVLVLPLVGFLPPQDPRVVGTVEAIQRELVVDGFVLRYRTEARHPQGEDASAGHADPAGRVDPAAVGGSADPADGSTSEPTGTVDGLPPGEGAFLLTTFWLADNLTLLGRVEEARRIFERLLGLANDVGLMSEEYDVVASRQLGNVPQAFSHVGLIITASNLSHDGQGPAALRGCLDPGPDPGSDPAPT